MDGMNGMNFNTGNAPAQPSPAAIAKAEEGYRNAVKETQKAFWELGKRVFEAEKDKADSDYASDMAEIDKKVENEKLWQLYRLSLEDKTKCEKCGAIITSDSVFCNKCGASVPERDFSVICPEEPKAEEPVQPVPPVTPVEPVLQRTFGPAPAAPAQKVCQKCGSPLLDDALFCEQCGQRVGEAPGAPVPPPAPAGRGACPKCGALILPDAMFCEACGTKVV